MPRPTKCVIKVISTSFGFAAVKRRTIKRKTSKIWVNFGVAAPRPWGKNQKNSRGSGFVLEYVKRFVVSVLRYRPLHGSTHIPTPSFLAAKRCIVNVHDRNSKCFLWSVLSALHESKVHKERLTNYTKYVIKVISSSFGFAAVERQTIVRKTLKILVKFGVAAPRP